MKRGCPALAPLSWLVLVLYGTLAEAGGNEFGGFGGGFGGSIGGSTAAAEYQGFNPAWQGARPYATPYSNQSFQGQQPSMQAYRFRELPESDDRLPTFRPGFKRGGDSYSAGGPGGRWIDQNMRVAPVFRPLDDRQAQPERNSKRRRYLGNFGYGAPPGWSGLDPTGQSTAPPR